MSEISPDGTAVALHANDDPLEAGAVIEQAKGAISARTGTTPEIAFELLRGLARSQRRSLQDYAAAVVANGGRLDS